MKTKGQRLAEIDHRLASESEKKRRHADRTISRNLDPIEFQKSLVKQRITQLHEDLPHIYGWKWYRWARAFYESINRINLLCAANQISKSSTAIRKNIEWAGNRKRWEIWDIQPKQFWYFYPTNEVATIEVEKKWIPEFMPRGQMKHDPGYGWDIEHSGGEVQALHFRSGVSIFFKSYSQKLINLQTATVHMITGDEEMPEDYVDELLARLRATKGIFNQVFTATQGYQLWYRAMECIGTADEAFITAFKQTISLEECQIYDDGTPSRWTDEAVKEAIAQCTSHNEVLRRIHGRFVKEEGRKYGAFDQRRNVGLPIDVPKDWKIYGGVDVGSGGKGRSAGAVVFIATDPLFTKGRVIRTWRGDLEETTAADILEKYRILKAKDAVTLACYDYQSREFGLIADRSGEPFIKADKARHSGEQILNTIFQAGALVVDGGVHDNQKLITELMSVPAGDKNRKFQDDLTDALRYVAAMIPWDFTKIAPGSALSFDDSETGDRGESRAPDASWTEKQYQEWEVKQRRGELMQNGKKRDDWQEYYDEIDEWNEQYGN